MPVITVCEECGEKIKMPPSQFNRAKNHFCSKQCHMKFMNRALNPNRMKPEVREKLHRSHIGRGKCKGYSKTYGKHTHRVIAEQMLGRPLNPEEVVHHIDGDKRNNNPSNLKVLKNQAEHAKLHFCKGGDEK